MDDLLYKAASAYQQLTEKEYKIRYRKSNKEKEMVLVFNKSKFYHLAGLQHLTDIKFGTQNAERIFKRILFDQYEFTADESPIKREDIKNPHFITIAI